MRELITPSLFIMKSSATKQAVSLLQQIYFWPKYVNKNRVVYVARKCSVSAYRYIRLKTPTEYVNQSRDLICIHGCHVVFTGITTRWEEPNIWECVGWALFYRPKNFCGKFEIWLKFSKFHFVCCDLTTCGLVDTYRHCEWNLRITLITEPVGAKLN